MITAPLESRNRFGAAGRRGRGWLRALLLTGLLLSAPRASAGEEALGLFEGHGDIGDVQHCGSVEFRAAQGSYTVAGGGENMWAGKDALHFVWKKVSGDVALAADIRWLGAGGNNHRKACLIIRQNLAADSPYADVAVHGDGLTSLQYRETAGDTTREVQANVVAPRHVRIEKQGDYVFLSLARKGGKLHAAGAAFRLKLQEPFYLGLGVCAHDNNALEKAEFTHVELQVERQPAVDKPVLESTLEVVPIASGDRRVVYHTRDHLGSPNWSKDGQALYFDCAGRLYRLPLAGGSPQLVETGGLVHCNSEHGLSPDGTTIALSDESDGGDLSIIYVLPLAGGPPRRVTPQAPSFFHGWSPDGATLTYCGERGGEYDVYTIPVSGGKEQCLTTTLGVDDGPEFSVDGRFIYFNSDRSGASKIWRMTTDGNRQEMVTTDEYNDWFPHPSPDGKWIVFLSYAKEVKEHPENTDVMLRLRALDTGETRILAKLFGGNRTINSPSWSPDSSRLAFTSFQLIRHYK